MRVEIENVQEVRLAMLNAESRVASAVRDVQDDYADDIKSELVRTSPVKTGKYKGNWDTETDDDVRYVKNDTEYGKYLVYPNQKMVGSPKADKPGEGIIHNVRGTVHRMKAEYSKDMIKRVRSVLDSMHN